MLFCLIYAGLLAKKLNNHVVNLPQLYTSPIVSWSADHLLWGVPKSRLKHRGDSTFVVAAPNSGMSCIFINHVLKLSFIPWLLTPFVGCLSCSYGLCVLLCCFSLLFLTVQHFGHWCCFSMCFINTFGLDWIRWHMKSKPNTYCL